MSPSETREQRLEAKRKRMPTELADLHWHLEDELTRLYLAWNEYKTLFATNERRIQLLNKTAPSFFVHFEDMVWRETMLHLCRLTDPPETARRSNLTLQRLPGAIDHLGLSARVAQEVSAAVQSTRFARDWRNRRIAHRNLDLVSDPKLKPLATASRADIEKSLEALAVPMNSVAAHYEQYHHDFAGVIAHFSGAQALLYFLSSGFEAEEARKNAGEQWSPPHW